MPAGFEVWISQQGFTPKTAGSRLSDVGRLDAAFGGLDRHYDRDGLRDALASLTYSRDDQRNGVANPSPVVIDGDLYTGLATMRQSLRLYIRFRKG
jgi:hypothetical protein